MIPDERLSSQVVEGAWFAPDDVERTALVDYERGGIALNDVSQGLLVQNWRGRSDGNNIWLAPEPYDNETLIFTTARPHTQLAFCFDQNMNVQLAVEETDRVWFRWYDAQAQDYTVSEFLNRSSPRLTLDDKREGTRAQSDVILCYMGGINFYYRQQRDRFGVERPLGTFKTTGLRRVGLTDELRLQFEFREA